jgi:ppGpp synthetase/RelA/SpoT-type nucleotidyltranferase
VSISAVNRLGRRIRTNGLTPDDQAILELVLLDAFAALSEVTAVIKAEVPMVAITPRLKTIGTIVDKLRRERRMALSRMRDVAGIRIVEDMNRVEQDVLVRQIVGAVGRCEVIDRRMRPSAGYRAVHVEVNCGGAFVEVQVRTALQDQWAQIVERLGDSWGRQIRYGGGPPDSAFELVPDFTRADLWELVVDAANWIDAIERLDAALALRDSEEDEEHRLEVNNSRRELETTLERMGRVVAYGV